MTEDDLSKGNEVQASKTSKYSERLCKNKRRKLYHRSTLQLNLITIQCRLMQISILQEKLTYKNKGKQYSIEDKQSFSHAQLLPI
ncbi:hypothetical protein Tco_0614095 [Tanacetum coccineum]